MTIDVMSKQNSEPDFSFTSDSFWERLDKIYSSRAGLVEIAIILYGQQGNATYNSPTSFKSTVKALQEKMPRLLAKQLLAFGK